MTFQRQELAFALKKMIKATENKEIHTSEEFLDQLKNEISTRKIITFNEVID